MLTQDRLKSQLRYDAETGQFHWLVSGTGRRQDRPAGRLDMGHLVIRIDGADYHASRLAWFYVHGEFPPDGARVRFNDGNPLNCRVANLRAGWTSVLDPLMAVTEAAAEANPRNALTQAVLQEELTYNPDTGDFFWREFKHGRVMDQPAGSPWSNGHRAICLNGVDYMANRLAWLYVHGELPPVGRKIKPIDGDPLNTRIGNLRLARTKGEADKHFFARHPHKAREYRIKRYQGMDQTKFIEMALAQDNRCAACGEKETVVRKGEISPLCVDHDHGPSQAVRGLLCNACNSTLGWAKDSQSRLRALADYLDRHAASQPTVIPLRSA